jgi:hypothetical protein
MNVVHAAAITAPAMIASASLKTIIGSTPALILEMLHAERGALQAAYGCRFLCGSSLFSTHQLAVEFHRK